MHMSSNNRFWLTVLFIAVITILAVWVALPEPRQYSWQLGPFSFNREIKVYEGLDLQGGLQVLLQAKTANGQPPAREDLNATRFIIEQRVNGLGVAEPIIQIQGDDKIVVELPGISNPDAAIAAFGQTGRLEFVDAGDEFIPAGTKIETTYPNYWPVPEDQLASASEGQPRKYATVLGGEHLRNAELAFSQQTRVPIVTFQTSPDGARRLSEFTAKNVGKVMPIVLDGEVISSPRINAVISDAGQIEGQFTQEEANALALQLKYGALKVPLEVVNTRSIGPSLGQDSVQRSILAGLVGLGVVALFMIIYYRLPGVLATIALLIYGAIVLALFKLIPVTLTLPGIAGFVLSIGMAVDANILIFERMREELRGGKSLRNAVEAGFSRAWPSIRDSNISTLITCTILFWFGSQFGASVVMGFALTLAIGVLVSMFTAIVVTRTLLRLTRRLWDLDESTATATGHLHTLFGY